MYYDAFLCNDSMCSFGSKTVFITEHAGIHTVISCEGDPIQLC